MAEFTTESFQHWPNFIVIGPGKAGTSWLFQVFNAHPEICTSSAKETIFFDEEYDRGLKWYSKFFKSCCCEDRPHAVGEISNTYIFSPVVPERIHRQFPEMKLISTLRNPIERAFSHYLFERRNAGVSGTFEEAIKQRPDFLTRGFYSQHLKPYFDVFPTEQIKVFIYDDLKADNEAFAAQLFDFLNVGPLPDGAILGKRVLGASEARSRVAAKLSVAAAHAIRAAGFPEVVTKIKNGFIAQLLFKPISRDNYPTMLPETHNQLREYFREDLERLSEMLERDLVKLWLAPSPELADAGAKQ